jgi:3-oxoacyl-[acyl-carrier-protein] synthase II
VPRELCPTQAKAFDTLYATSRATTSRRRTPRPYDAERDGLVVGEGGAFLVLEELEAARARGATIHAEIIGYSTNSDGTHVTRPEENTMRIVMENALKTARITAEEVDYVNGHGTATMHGDQAESRATSACSGRHADQLAEEFPRPHARRLRRARGLVQHRDDEPALVRATLNLDKSTRVRPLDYIRETAARSTRTSWCPTTSHSAASTLRWCLKRFA